MQVHEMPDIDYSRLQTPPQLDQDLLGKLDCSIKGLGWIASHQCITMIRQINKYHPELIGDLVTRYSSAMLDLFADGKRQILKNLLRCFKEMFSIGRQVNVEKAVATFLPVILKKAAVETGYIREMSQEVLTILTLNCGYDASFTIALQSCFEKNSQVAQFSLKLLAALIQQVGSNITRLSENTLTTIMRVLLALIEGKRNTMRTAALDICVFIFMQIGDQNYLQLMVFALKVEGVQIMGHAMETHRAAKNKPEPLASALKKRKSDYNYNYQNNRYAMNTNNDCY